MSINIKSEPGRTAIYLQDKTSYAMHAVYLTEIRTNWHSQEQTKPNLNSQRTFADADQLASVVSASPSASPLPEQFKILFFNKREDSRIDSTADTIRAGLKRECIVQQLTEPRPPTGRIRSLAKWMKSLNNTFILAHKTSFNPDDRNFGQDVPDKPEPTMKRAANPKENGNSVRRRAIGKTEPRCLRTHQYSHVLPLLRLEISVSRQISMPRPRDWRTKSGEVWLSVDHIATALNQLNNAYI